MPIVTVDQVNDYLSNPPWSPAQRSACALLIDERQEQLRGYLQVPIDPVRRTERVPILPSGLIATTAPVHTLLSINGVAPVEDVLPEGYYWRDQDNGWLATTTADQFIAATSALDLLAGVSGPYRAMMDYMAGWGDKADLVGGIIRKVAAVMINRHDDTVTAAQLDAENPPQIKEEFTEQELRMFNARRRIAGGR